MHRAFRPALRACAATLILAHLLVIAVAWSPALHEWLHGDATDPHHDCAALVYVGGHLDEVVPTVSAVSSDSPIAWSFLEPGHTATTDNAIFSSERAPPAA